MRTKTLMFIIDFTLLALIVLLNAPRFTGLRTHELLGACFMLPFALHLLLSWKWITHRLRHLASTANFRKNISLLLNSTLFILCILQVVSGLAISQSLTPNWFTRKVNVWGWRTLHNQTYVALLLIACFHIAVNWPRIASYLRTKAVKKRTAIVPLQLRSLKCWMYRTFVLLLSALPVVAVAAFLVGHSQKHAKLTNDIIRLKQNMVTGSVQLAGITIAVAVLILLSRQVLKIRM